MKKTLLALLLCLPCLGQAPTGTVLIDPEGVTIASTTGTGVVYKFGAGTAFNTITNPVYPLVVDCSSAPLCALLGGDPAPGVTKSIYAVEQTTSYTVTLSDGTVINVPPISVALPVTPPVSTTPVACPPAPYNQATPFAPHNCLPAAGGLAVGQDGSLLAIQAVNAQTGAIYLQYCEGTVCNPPFAWNLQPIVIAPTPTLGGDPGGTIPGTLYIFPSSSPVNIIKSGGAINTATIPPAL